MLYFRLSLAAIFTGLAIAAAVTGDHIRAACYAGAAVLWITLAILDEDRS
ncbi:hypothetical protein [Streptomyces sp. NPDC096323]